VHPPNGINFALSLAMVVRLKKLDDADVRKLQALHRWDTDTHDAIVWLRGNRSKFKMEVFEPPIMVLTVPERRFVNAVESCFNAAQLKVCLLNYGITILRSPVRRRLSLNVKKIWIRSITTSTILKLSEGSLVSLLGIALGRKTCSLLHP
jgi:hypothetical protein